MPNFLILYASAATLALSAVTTLAVIAVWMLGEFRPREAPGGSVVSFAGLGDEVLALDVPQTAP